MRALLRVGLLALAIALGTACMGWWVVPAIGALWGLLAPRQSKASLTASAAAALAWVGLLVVVAIRGPMLDLADQVGGILAIPGWLFILVTVAFPAILAGSAAELSRPLAAGLRGKLRADI